MADCDQIQWWNKGILCQLAAYQDCPKCVAWLAAKLADDVSRGIAPVTETGPAQHPGHNFTPDMSPMLGAGVDFEPSHALVMNLLLPNVPSVIISGDGWRIMTGDEVAEVEDELNALSLPDDPLRKHRTLAEFYAEKGLVLYALHSMAEFARIKIENPDLPAGAHLPDLSAFINDEQDVPIPDLSPYSADERPILEQINGELMAIRSHLVGNPLGRNLAYAECLYRYGQSVRARPALEAALELLGERVRF